MPFLMPSRGPTSGARVELGLRGALAGALALAACTPTPSPLSDAARAAITDTVRAESRRMLEVMRTRQVDSVLAFYGRHTAYVGDGAVGDWGKILAGAPPRYATYAKVECRWQEPLRIDVLARDAAVLTGVLDCEKSDTAGRAWREVVARTEVLAPEAGRWRIVAVHESSAPGSAGLH